jgi:D-threonate/D-erythronate kinase
VTPSVVIVADDLTGAADTGVGFCRSGRTAAVTWAGLPLAATSADVLAIDTGTRACDSSTAYTRVADTVRAARELGVATLYKKVDSTLRGHVGVEVDAALSNWNPGGIALVAAAFPRTGRTTVKGQVCVDGQELDGADIVAHLRRAGLSTRHLGIDTVRDGSLAAAVEAGRDGGVRAFVCDSSVDADLAAIARAGMTLDRAVVWVGSGGLAAELPSFLGPGSAVLNAPTSPATAAPAAGPVLLVVGSRSAVSRAQVARVEAAGVVRLEVPTKAEHGSPALVAVTDRLVHHLRAGDDVLLTLAAGPDTGRLGDDPGNVPAPDDARHAQRLGELLRPHASLVGALVATGGDTATAVLRAWDTTALRLVGEVEPGVALSTSVAPHPVPVVTKAGGFGTPDTLVQARAKLESVLSSPPT